MTDQQLTLENALDILEINNPDSMVEADLEKYKRKAFIRWHPDKVEHTGDKEKIAFYNKQSQLIEPSVELLKSYLRGEYDPSQKFDSAHSSFERKDTEEILRENAPMMQEEIRKVWSFVKETGFMKTEETVVLSEGHKVKDLLNDDLQSDIVPGGVIMIFHGFAFSLILSLIGIILGIFSKNLGSLIAGIAQYGFLIHFIICLLSILPMSRFWLSDSLNGFIEWYYKTIEGLIPTESGFWNVVAFIGIIVGYLIKFIIVYPIYLITMAIVGEKVIRRVVKQQTYYANLADWYIDQLIGANEQNLSDEQLFHLSHAYSNLTKVHRQ